MRLPQKMPRLRLSGALVFVALLTLTGCASDSESEGVSLFESGALERFEIDGRAIDAEIDYVVMCLWASSNSGGLSIIPSTEDAEQARVTDVQIDFDAETRRLTGVSVRAEGEWVLWDGADAGEAPTFRVDGPDFTLEGTITGDARSFEIAVAGTCETHFD